MGSRHDCAAAIQRAGIEGNDAIGTVDQVKLIDRHRAAIRLRQVVEFEARQAVVFELDAAVGGALAVEDDSAQPVEAVVRFELSGGLDIPPGA